MEDVNVVERIGGLQNAYTDIDVTNYHSKVLSTDWELALDVNKELALTPRLLQKFITKEREVIIEEMKRYEDEPSAKVEETFHTMLYPGTKLGMRIIGTEKSLRAADATRLKKYHDDWYTPERMVVVLAGNLVESQKAKVKIKVAEWFGDLKGKANGDIEVVKDHQDRPKFEVVTKPDAQQAHLVLGLRIFSRGSQERFAWAIFNMLMGVSFTSRLFKEIREKRGLCYHIRSGSDGWKDVGNWSIYAGVATDRVEEAVKAIAAELTKAADKGVTNDEVKVAQKRIKTMLAFRSEDPEFLNEYYGRQELFGDPILTLDEYLKKIDAVTKGEINTLVRKYFVTKHLNLALVWNKPRDEKLEKLLKI
jgi:predicted Zn-dependent peptidase